MVDVVVGCFPTRIYIRVIRHWLIVTSMMTSIRIIRQALLCFLCVCALSSAQQNNPSILEDSRVHPTVDGTFGFLYRTQDGIAHAAKGDPGGAVHGRFSYTDPTGLKVNFNYNAGAQAVAQKQQEQQQQPQYVPQSNQPHYTQTYQPQNEVQAYNQPSAPARNDYYNQIQNQPQQQQQQPAHFVNDNIRYG